LKFTERHERSAPLYGQTFGMDRGEDSFPFNKAKHDFGPKSYQSQEAHFPKHGVNFQRKVERRFEYKPIDFPPLPYVQEDRINELSSAVKNIQNCLDILMGHHSSPNYPQQSSNPGYNNNKGFEPNINNPSYLSHNYQQSGNEAKN
jgi:hypothetical protein